MTTPARPYVRHVCAAHQREPSSCLAHGRGCPAASIRPVAAGSPEGIRLAERARHTLSRSPTLWVQTAFAAGPIWWHGCTPDGSVALAVSAENPLAAGLPGRQCDLPTIVAAAEVGPAGGPDRVPHRAWLTGWLRETDELEVTWLNRLITAQTGGPQVNRHIPDLALLVVDVAEVLVPEGQGPEVIHSVDLADYALATPSC